jgi:KaiC/GvpD/RAD55 family RecA-like ATPase
MNEQKIIAAFLQNRDAWSQAKSHITEKDLSPEGSLILKEIERYYDADKDAKRVDHSILLGRIERIIPSAKLYKAIEGVIQSLPVDVSGINVARELVEIKSHGIGLQLASLLAAGKRGKQVDDLIAHYQAVQQGGPSGGGGESGVEGPLVSVPLSELLGKHFDKSGLIQLWPKSLNDHIDGGCKPGHHVLIFAPTEMGKSLFALNATAGFLRQQLPVLYIGNEDPAADLLMRLISRLTGMNKYEVMAEPDRAQALLDQRNYDKFVLAPLAPGSFRRIDELVLEHEPRVVVLDQLRNIDVDSENRTQALEKAATEARNLAKRRGVLVISVSQAADSATGKTVLGRGDVDSSNVGIPGQCDLMIGIGATSEMEEQNIRVLSFPKNKLSGKHDRITVTIDPLLSKVYDHGPAANDDQFENRRRA